MNFKSSTNSRQSFSSLAIAVCLASVIAAFSAANAFAAAPGARDLSFGARGTAAFSVAGYNDVEARAIAVQTDGKILVAGRIGVCCPRGIYDFGVARLNTNGTLDTSFGTGGVAVTDFFSQTEVVFDIAVQPDGKIVAAGSTPFIGNTEIYGFKLVRYLPDGSLDTTFGTNGRVYENFDDMGGVVRRILVQSDGKIVAVGGNLDSTAFMARFNSDGSIDNNFASGGRFVSATQSGDLYDVAQQTDGKIVVVQTPFDNTNSVRVLRFNTNGTLDTNFGSGGQATRTWNAGGSGVFNVVNPVLAIQTDGKILVSGRFNSTSQAFYYASYPPLVRFNSDGSLDSNFAASAYSGFQDCGGCVAIVSKILPLADGRFYTVGFFGEVSFTTTFAGIAVSRYLNNGTFDASYGFRGTSLVRYSNVDRSIYSVADAALQADGKIDIAATGLIDQYTSAPYYAYLAVRVNAAVTPPSVRGDFDGDRRTDFAVFRPSTRYWYVLNSGDDSFSALRYGANTDVLTPSDYNDDLKTDIAVFRPGDGGWYINSSLPAGGGFGGIFGQTDDISAPEDYDGDGYADLAVFRPSNGTWYIRYSSRSISGINSGSVAFGAAGDRPVAGDYDGDGRADVAVFRPSNGYWYILRSSDNGISSIQFGIATDKTVQSDYDGDLKTDVAVFRDGFWYYLKSSTGAFGGIQFGAATDKPVPGDYDGDGKADFAVFRPSEGNWYALKSSDSSFVGRQFGTSEDAPIPFTFVR